ncbi:unnamed protein product [Cochlearia groenlandica]
MLNLPDSLYEDYTQLATASASSSTAATVVSPPDITTIFRWINDLRIRPSDSLLLYRARSDFALENLANNRDKVEILPLMLWNSVGIVGMLLQEVVKVYQHISHPVYHRATPTTRVYNVLLLFQTIAYHPETRSNFLKANMPHYFFPLMDIAYNDKPLEFLRLGAIGVIAHLLKTPLDGAAIRFLMDTGALNYCTRPIEIGNTESKTLAVFILHRILMTDEGLQYCCVLADRFFVIDGLLKKLLVYLSSMARPSPSLFNLVVGCYFMLSQKARARDGLRRYIPVMLFDGTFANLLAADPEADENRKQLIKNLESNQ